MELVFAFGVAGDTQKNIVLDAYSSDDLPPYVYDEGGT